MSVIIDSDNNNVNITEEPINVTVSLGGPDVAAVWGGITGDLTDQTDLQAALDDKVPYTGATGDVNLGEYGIQLGNLEFDNTPTNVPTSAGSVYWSDTDGTLNMVLKGGQTISRIGETQHIRALNNTGVQIARGKVVYVVGAQGQRLTIALADADTEILSKDTIGFTSEAIADGAEGFVIVQGVINNVNTNGMADGATVYLSQTAGSYTTTPPVDPAHLVILGFIVNGGSGGAGSIYVKVDNGYELGELHDVNTTGATNGQVLTYNGTTWVPATNGSGTVTSIATSAPITGGTITTSGTIGITQAGAAADGYLSATDWNTFNNKQAALTNPVTGTGTAGQVAYWSGTNTQTGSSNLFWDAVNNRLGIGKNNPAQVLDVFGNLSIQSANANNATFSITTDGFGAKASVTGGNFNTRIFYFAPGSGDTRFFTTSVNSKISIWDSTPSATIELTSNASSYILNSLSLGTSTNSARLHVRGSGTTSATTALLVQDSAGAELFKVRDDGKVFVSKEVSGLYDFFVGALDINVINTTSIATFQGIRHYKFTPNLLTLPGFQIQGSTYSNTSGILENILSTSTFSPTSGTAVINDLTLRPTINQTGGANGITRGLYVNPTLTAAADWRSVETSNNTGWAVYAGGTANSYFGGRVGINTLSPAHQLDVSGNIRTNTYLLTPAIYSGGGLVFGVSGGTAAMSIRTTTRNTQLYDSTEPSDAGQRLQVYGSTLLRGSGTTSATTALLVQNSTPSELFKVLDNGTTTINGLTSIVGSSTGTTPILRVVNNSSGNFTFSVDNTGTGNSNFGLNIDGLQKATIGYSRTGNFLGIFLQGYTENYFMMQINPDGSFQKNRSSDGAAEFKVFNGGSTIIGAATVNASAILQADSTTKGFLPPRMTTTQKNAIATPAAGLVVYDTTLNKLCVYTTAWETITSA